MGYDSIGQVAKTLLATSKGKVKGRSWWGDVVAKCGNVYTYNDVERNGYVYGQFIERGRNGNASGCEKYIR